MALNCTTSCVKQIIFYFHDKQMTYRQIKLPLIKDGIYLQDIEYYKSAPAYTEDPDQMAPSGAVWSWSALFAIAPALFNE